MKPNYWDEARELLPNSNCLRRSYAAIIVNQYGEKLNVGWNEAETACRTCAREGYEHNAGDYGECSSIHAEQMAMLGMSLQELDRATMYLVCDKESNPKPCPICARMMDYVGVELKEEPQ